MFMQINSSGIKVNLIQLETSRITYSKEHDLKLDPGSFSVDLDGYTFNATVNRIINTYTFVI